MSDLTLIVRSRSTDGNLLIVAVVAETGGMAASRVSRSSSKTETGPEILRRFNTGALTSPMEMPAIVAE